MIYWQTEDKIYTFNQYHPKISYFYEIFEIMSPKESNAIFGELDLEIQVFDLSKFSFKNSLHVR